jgi:GTP-binding protein
MQKADSPFDAEMLEVGRKLFERECVFVAGAAELARLPEPSLTEVAFAGRSNVGKSSLINALTRHNALARTSRTPGRTQQINFFQLGNVLMLVDLPGYGYAKASKQKIGTWTALIHDYLLGRPNLRRICVLIDSRHGLKETDLALMAELDTAAVVYQFVLTKTDKISAGALKALIGKIEALFPAHPAAYPEIIATSARSGLGIDQLRAALATLATPDQFG